MAPSVAERRFVEDGLAQDLRLDGRGRLDFRPMHIQPSLIPQASGSARVKMGGTDVLVGVKVEIGTPLPAHPSSGRLEFSVDVSSTASPTFEGRGGDDLAAELTYSLTQCFAGGGSGEGAAFAPTELGIIPGRTCWVVNVDGVVLAADGALLDVLAIATKAALADTRIPKVSVVGGTSEEDLADFEVDDDPSASLQLSLDSVPVVVTLRQCGREYYMDASSVEESLEHPGLSVAVNRKGEVCGFLKTGVSGMDPSAQMQMIEVGQQQARKLHAAIDAAMPVASQ